MLSRLYSSLHLCKRKPCKLPTEEKQTNAAEENKKAPQVASNEIAKKMLALFGHHLRLLELQAKSNLKLMAQLEVLYSYLGRTYNNAFFDKSSYNSFHCIVDLLNFIKVRILQNDFADKNLKNLCQAFQNSFPANADFYATRNQRYQHQLEFTLDNTTLSREELTKVNLTYFEKPFSKINENHTYFSLYLENSLSQENLVTLTQNLNELEQPPLTMPRINLISKKSS